MTSVFQTIRRPMEPLLVAAALLTAGGAALPAFAHHSFAMFDRDKRVTLKGVVKEFQWTNPHVFVELVVQDAKNQPENWSIEGASPNMLFRQGWTINSFRPGDQITVVINPLRDGSRGGSLVNAVLPSGKALGDTAARPPG